LAVYVLFWALTLTFGLIIRGRVATYIFLFFVFIFIGLRLETGFDWPVYKAIYESLAAKFSLVDAGIYSLIYGQELGFLLFLGISAKYLPNYELFQALVTFALLWSTVFLAKAVGEKKTALVIAVAMTYLMWSVGFSTLRQSMAISFFNFGLVYFLRRKHTRGTILFFMATTFQISSLVYIAAFVFTRFVWTSHRPPKLQTFFLASFAAAILSPVAIQSISMISSLASEKLAFYQGRSNGLTFGVLDLVFLMFFAAAALLSSANISRPSAATPHANEIRRLLMVMAAIGTSSNFFSVLRDRVSYEAFLLVSICLLLPGVRYRWQFIAYFVCFGLFTSAISIFPYPYQLAFQPYQNVITHYLFDLESTGVERNAKFMEEFAKRLSEN
jgi:hypothetical protein